MVIIWNVLILTKCLACDSPVITERRAFLDVFGHLKYIGVDQRVAFHSSAFTEQAEPCVFFCKLESNCSMGVAGLRLRVFDIRVTVILVLAKIFLLALFISWFSGYNIIWWKMDFLDYFGKSLWRLSLSGVFIDLVNEAEAWCSL